MMKLFFVIFFFCLSSQANDCINKALAAAQKAEGGAAGTANNAAAGGVRGGKITAGMTNKYGKEITEDQASFANHRAEILKAATGRTLTQEETILLLSIEDSKILLGAKDWQLFVNEINSPGAGAKAAAEAAAAEARKKAAAAEQARLEAQQKTRDDAIWFESQRKAANPYLDHSFKPSAVFNRDAMAMDNYGARAALSNYAPAGTPALARAVEGLNASMGEFERRIAQIEQALRQSNPGGVVERGLKEKLRILKQECQSLSAIAATAGLNGDSTTRKVSDFISANCR